jgi:NAD(P)-dependent dehydrogenase (short-subunit alcohol dehydrogenase family)
MKPAELFDLSGKTAVVIGGTGELCGAMAEGMAAAGGRVVLVGRDAAKAEKRMKSIRRAGGDVSFEACDATSRTELSSLAERLFSNGGAVNILVNGAGVNSATSFLEISDEEMDRIISINLKAVMVACQVFGARMVDAGGGSIINLGSMSGIIPLSRVFAYSATKAAVHNLSKNLAREWAPRGLRVNTLVPGFFPAEQNRKVLTPERVASIMGHTPMNRFGEAHELVGATLLLASDAGNFITGSEIVVDGGFASMSI